ncbi:hypothetical protein AXF42_Ash001157 [Apostasia shenzhenica]|uniref:Uncharacterized protein n=1 Tax=Apostasia shenzhenica TaxID=1088818 RepID=A0A2I0AU49_9ASPA|nr:hypothetical protein AXF42_Ash001157 [Apostasia shenzhenica]
MIRRAAVAWMTLRRHVEIFAIQSSAPKVSRFQFSGGVIDHLRQRSAAVSRGYAHARMRNRIPPTARKPSESESDSSSSDEDDAIDPYAIGEDDGGESDLECLVLDFGAGEEEQKKRSEEQSRSLEEEEEEEEEVI